MIDTSEMIESVYAYREAKIQVFPVPYGTKKAELCHKRFQSEWISNSNIDSMFSSEMNIAGYGGIISNNLAILDVDNYQKFNGTIARNKRFQEMRNATWEAYSASGKPHIYLRTAYPIHGINYVKTLGLEIRGQGLYALMPPSAFLKDGQRLLYGWHRRSGSILELNERETDELKEIIPFVQWVPKSKFDLGLKPFGLSNKYYEIICFGSFEKYGFSEHGNRSRSEAEFHVLLHFISLGWNDADILSFLNLRAHSSTRFKQRGSDHTIAEIHRARIWHREHQSLEDRKILEFSQMISSFDWKSFSGRSAIVDRMVMDYIISVAQRTGKTENISLPIREIAERTGRGTQAVLNSIKRLRSKSGLIILQKSADLFHGSEYGLNLPTTPPQSYTYGQEKDCSDNGGELGHDSWRTSRSKRQSLLKTGLLVYETIKSHPGISYRRAHELVSQFVSLRTVERKIKHLREIGAIEKFEEGWRITSMTLDEIAHRIDSKGQLQRQKDFHKKERDLQSQIAHLSVEERTKERKRFLYKRNKHLTFIGNDQWINLKTGEIFSVK